MLVECAFNDKSGNARENIAAIDDQEEQPRSSRTNLQDTVSVHTTPTPTENNNHRDEQLPGQSGDDTVVVSLSMLHSLTNKIDTLTKIVVEQKEELLDIEKRLKMEFRQREKNMQERIESLIKGKQYSLYPDQTTESAPQASRQDAQTKKKRRQKPSKIEQDRQCQDVNVNSNESEDVLNFVSQKSKDQKTRRGIHADMNGTVQNTNDMSDMDKNETVQYKNDIYDKNVTVQDVNNGSEKDDGFVLVQPGRRRSTQSVRDDSAYLQAARNRGNGTPRVSPNADHQKPALGKLLGAKRIKKQVFYLGGVSPDCSAEDITKFCAQYCDILQCQMLTSRRSGT